MKDNTHYFDHDYNAQNDPKIEAMLCEKGNCSYGVFWRIIERLAQEPSHKLKTEYKILAFSFHEPVEFIQGIVEDFDLFVISKGYFWSERLLKHFEKRSILSEKGRIGGLKRVANLKGGLKGGLNDTSSILKESKEKEIEIKEKEIIKENIVANSENERTKREQSKLKVLMEHEYFKNEDFLELWEVFSKKRTPYQKILNLRDIQAHSIEETIQALKNTIAGGWKGIVWPKNDKSTNGKKPFLLAHEKSQQSMESLLKDCKQAKEEGREYKPAGIWVSTPIVKIGAESNS